MAAAASEKDPCLSKHIKRIENTLGVQFLKDRFLIQKSANFFGQNEVFHAAKCIRRFH